MIYRQFANWLELPCGMPIETVVRCCLKRKVNDATVRRKYFSACFIIFSTPTEHLNAFYPRWIARYWTLEKIDGWRVINEGLIHRFDHENSLVYSIEKLVGKFLRVKEETDTAIICVGLRCLAWLEDDVDVCLSLYMINHWINRERRGEKATSVTYHTGRWWIYIYI